MSRLSQEAEKSVSVTSQSRNQHHDISASMTQTDYTRLEKLKPVIKGSNPFQFQSDHLMNIITKSQSVHTDILQREEKGKNAYQDFVRERKQGPVILWETISKLNLKIRKTAAKTTKIVQGNRTTELQEN